MVMDATQPQQPSPQSVGREFVRQYYTLLNKAPNHLHRFYNNNSSFIHGESTLVVGQKNIHNRIQQLNFHDCHAKISQVDAQATLGNGVVVQVTGELSNDGQPMRRFTQTFVLAAQSPKKYYVHNDIFRYQDMYSDEDNEGEIRSENGDDLEQPTSTVENVASDTISQASTAIVGDTPTPLPTQLVSSGGVMPQPQTQQPNAPQQHAIYYSMPTTGRPPVPVLAAPQGAAVPLGTQFPAAPASTIAPQVVPVSAGVSQVNGIVAHDDLLAGMQQPQQQPAVAATALPAVVAASPAVQNATIVPVAAGANVLNAHATITDVVGVANVAALPQNAAGAYQQPQLIQQPLVQQSQQHHQSPPQSASAASLPSQSLSPNTCDFDESNNSLANNENIVVAKIPPTEPAAIELPISTAPVVEDFKTINEQQLQEKYEAAKHQQNEPKTYANLFKTTSTSPSSFVNAAMQQQQQVQQQQQQQQQQQSSNATYQSTTSIPSATFTQSNASTMSGFNRNASNTVDNNSNLSNQAPLPQRNSSSRVNKDYEQRRTSNAQQFGDNQQLFLGNIPHHASEEELKTLFARFGTIIELRILSKPGGKLPPGVRNPLNYGFITYEEAESVQTCLAACPLYFPEGAHDAQKLNVEEKKPRMRDLPPRQSMGNNMNSGSGMGGGAGQRNMSGGPQSRSLSNTGGGAGGGNSGMMRGSSAGNNMSRGSSSGQRIGGGFNRNDNRSGSQSNGGQIRGGGGNNNTQSSGGNNYAGRR